MLLITSAITVLKFSQTKALQMLPDSTPDQFGAIHFLTLRHGIGSL